MSKNDSQNPTVKILKANIDRYCSLKEPGHALLVTGKWGSGKTYWLKRLFHENKQPFHYVSLYGLRSIDDIHARVQAAISPQISSLQNSARNHPFLNNMLLISGLVAGFLTKDVFQITSGITLLATLCLIVSTLFTYKYFLNYKAHAKHPIVFDDFERCNIDKIDLMGALNTYVEHEKCRVIIVANEEELVKTDDEETRDTYLKTKEKIIGQTIHIRASSQEFMAGFMNSLPTNSSFKHVLHRHEGGILEVFKHSQCDNLRILDRILLDLKHLYDQLEPRFKDDVGMMDVPIRLFTAYGVEIKSSRLHRGNLYKEVLPSIQGGLIATTIEKYRVTQDSIRIKYNRKSVNSTDTSEIPYPDILRVCDHYEGLHLLADNDLDDLYITYFLEGYLDSSHLSDAIDAYNKAEDSYTGDLKS